MQTNFTKIIRQNRRGFRMTEWQDYENITNKPENIKAIEVILSKEKPTKDTKGFIMTTDFHYEKCKDGSKLWVRFWEY